MTHAAPTLLARPECERCTAVSDDVRLAQRVGASAATLALYSARAVYGLLIARLLGGAALGVYVVAFAWIDLLTHVGLIGLDGAAIAFTARTAGPGGRRAVDRILTRALARALVSSAAVAGLLILIVPSALNGDSDGLARSLMILAPAIPALTVNRICNSVAQGLGVMRVDFYSNGLLGTVLMPLGMTAALALGFGGESAAIGMTVSAVGAALTAWWLSRRVVARLHDAEPAGPDPTAGMTTFAFSIAGVKVFSLLAMRLDMLLLGLYAASASTVTPLGLGAYAAAAELAGGLRKLRQPFDTAFAPVAARTTVGHDRPLADSFAQVSGWVLLMACPAVCLVVLAGGAALHLYGATVRIGTPWLIILGAATAMHGLLGLFETILVTRRPDLNFRNTVVAAAFQAAVSLALIPPYGPLGSALGVLASYAVLALMRVHAVRRVAGLGVPWRSMRRPVLACAVALGPAVVCRLAIAPPGGELAAAAAFMTAYVLVLRRVGLEPADRLLASALFRPRLRTD